MDSSSPSVTGTPSFGVRGAFALFHDSWKLYKQQWKDIVIFQLVTTLISGGAVFLLGLVFGGGATGLLPLFSGKGGGPTLSLILTAGFAILLAVAAMIVITAWIGTAQGMFYMHLLDGKAMELGAALRQGFSRFLGFLGTSILAALIVGVGFMLFIVPGIIWGIRYFFAPFVYLAEGKSGMAALRRSQEIVRGMGWVLLARFYVMSVIAFVLGLLQLIPIAGPLLVMPFFVTPLLALLSWYLFREFERTKREQQNAVSTYSKGKKAALLLPIIIVPFIFVAFIGALVIKGAVSNSYPAGAGVGDYQTLYDKRVE